MRLTSIVRSPHCQRQVALGGRRSAPSRRDHQRGRRARPLDLRPPTRSTSSSRAISIENERTADQRRPRRVGRRARRGPRRPRPSRARPSTGTSLRRCRCLRPPPPHIRLRGIESFLAVLVVGSSRHALSRARHGRPQARAAPAQGGGPAMQIGFVGLGLMGRPWRPTSAGRPPNISCTARAQETVAQL